MSYARFGAGGSDVYIYQDVDFGLRCQLCPLVKHSFETRSRSEMLTHIQEHRKAGHCVPESTSKALEDELAEEGDDAPGTLHVEMDRRERKAGVRE